MSNWAFYETHFAAARLRHYLTACGGDTARAMHLYRWNADVSGAFWEGIGYLEVALRNAVDAVMVRRHASLGRASHWIYDDAKELGRDANGLNKHRQPYKDVHLAKQRVRNNKMTTSPEQILSEISFGFWHQMVSKHQLFLWPDLSSAFSNAPNRAYTTVHDPVARIRTLRNRIGHHHRIWSTDLGRRHDDLLDIAGYIDLDLRSFLARQSRVPTLLAQRP